MAAVAVAVFWLKYLTVDSSNGHSSLTFTGQVWCGYRAAYAFTSAEATTTGPTNVEHTPNTPIAGPGASAAQSSRVQAPLALPYAPHEGAASGTQPSAPRPTVGQPSSAQASAPYPRVDHPSSSRASAPAPNAAQPHNAHAPVALPPAPQPIAPHHVGPQYSAPRPRAAQSYTPRPNRNRNSSRSSSNARATRTRNEWNDFQADNAGRGWSGDDFKREYMKYKARSGIR